MLENKLKELTEKRKKGEITIAEFYRELLVLVGHLADELSTENIKEEQIKRQIPFLLTFLKAQIKNMANRGN
jgi:hypothetical protein